VLDDVYKGFVQVRLFVDRSRVASFGSYAAGVLFEKRFGRLALEHAYLDTNPIPIKAGQEVDMGATDSQDQWISPHAHRPSYDRLRDNGTRLDREHDCFALHHSARKLMQQRVLSGGRRT
jgi:hypothetical protein